MKRKFDEIDTEPFAPVDPKETKAPKKRQQSLGCFLGFCAFVAVLWVHVEFNPTNQTLRTSRSTLLDNCEIFIDTLRGNQMSLDLLISGKSRTSARIDVYPPDVTEPLNVVRTTEEKRGVLRQHHDRRTGLPAGTYRIVIEVNGIWTEMEKDIHTGQNTIHAKC